MAFSSSSVSSPEPARRNRWLWWALGLGVLIASCAGCSAFFAGILLLPEATPISATAVAVTAAPSSTALSATTSSSEPSPTTAAKADIPFRAVVQIVALDEEGEPLWTGSGSIISPEGLILTNAHVALPEFGHDPSRISLLILTTEQEDQPPRPRFLAKVVQADRDLDLAVLRITHDVEGRPLSATELNLPYLPLGRAEDLRLGDELVILGYPGIGGDTITLTKGEVAGFVEDPPYGPRAFIKTAATLAGGNSGGAALNAQGELVAVPTLLGAGSTEVVDCRVLVDTNHDGVVDERDSCVPIGGFLNALRPVDLALPLIEAARANEVALPTPPPTQQPRTGLEDIWRHPGPVLDKKDFDTPVAGWTTTDDDPTLRIRYADGVMYVHLLQNNLDQFLTSDVDADDVVVKVRAQVTRPAGDGEYGLICRYQNIDNFYAATVTEDGDFAVWKVEGGEFVALHPYAALPPKVHFDPAQWNELGLICFGHALALRVNDVPVITVSDTTMDRRGGAGLIIGTFDEPDFEVAFDDLEIRAARR